MGLSQTRDCSISQPTIYLHLLMKFLRYGYPRSSISEHLRKLHAPHKRFLYIFSEVWMQVSWPSSLVHSSDSSSDVVRMWVRIPAWPVAMLVSLSKTLNHNSFVLRMGREAAGPVCCVMHVKEPRTLIVKEKGLVPVFLDSRLEHPAGWICACYKSSVLY